MSDDISSVEKQSNKYKSQLFIGSEEYYRNNISLPIHLKLTNNEIDYIVSKIKKFILVQA